MARPGLVLLALLAAMAAGCGKKEEPKVDADTERREALERSKSGAFGTQVKGLEAAKGLEADLNRKSQEAIEKADKDAK